MLESIYVLERDVGTYLYGRTMYEMMTGWENDPTVAGNPRERGVRSDLSGSTEDRLLPHPGRGATKHLF